MTKIGKDSSPAFPGFSIKEVEELYNYDLTLPREIYNSLLDKDRKVLIADIAALLKHAATDCKLFKKKGVPLKHTYFVWHALFLLKDLEAVESLPAVLEFFRQDEDIVGFYLGDLLYDHGWEFLYVLGRDQLRLLVDVVKDLIDELGVRMEILQTLRQVTLRHPEKRIEIESYLRELLHFVSTREVSDDAYVDEITAELLQVIGSLGFSHLFPAVKEALDEQSLPLFLRMDWKEFEEEHILQKLPADEPAPELSKREELYAEYLEAINSGDEDEYDDDDEYDDFEYVDESNDDEETEELTFQGSDGEVKPITTFAGPEMPYVKTEPDVGKNDPCPCGSGIKYKKCHGKN